MRSRINIIIIFFLSIHFSGSFAQELDKVVFVENAFVPIIENAAKISFLPILTDTLKPQPEISYSVLPSRIDAKYKIKSIKPAKLVGSPLDKLYKSRIRLGFGNYATPLAEFSINNLRSKEYAVGAYIYHKSSHSKLKLDNGHKVPAGYGVTNISAYGKRFYNNFNVEGDVDFNCSKNKFYGYNTANFTDTLPSIDSKEFQQLYSQFKARAEVYSTIADSNTLQYRLALMADYFGDNYSNNQNHIDIPGQVSFMVQSFHIDLNARYHYFQSTLDTLRGTNDYILQFRPIINKNGDQWKLFIGANTYFSSYGKANFFPEAQLSFAVLDKVMEAYFGVSGHLEINNFSKIAGENKFINPGLYTKNTKHKLIGYGGVKGVLSSNAGYKLDLSFDTMEDQYFFVNDTLNSLENRFITVYDNLELIKLNGEFWYSPYTYLDFYLKAAYNSYNMATEAKPWHKPITEISFTTQYNYKEKIYASLDVINFGKRYAKNHSDLTKPIELKAIWDVNVGLEYKYSNVLSAFINIHNLLSQQYSLWNQYPNQKFNLMLGISYKF